MERILDMLKQYRYGILILVIGIGLMLFPTSSHLKQEESIVHTYESPGICELLTEILGQIEGVGHVQVMLTESAGETTIYQKNTDHSGDTVREDTVVITGDTREEMGLIQQKIPPKYQGALIVCQGGDRATVRLAVVEAVSALTGLSSDKITVLKMK